ncbi:uncharacterized protein JCM15063_005745 [Sporobolomyces koalae]|uniref:uncharacterized protein n=1 Tax=Sporobolomyces koalae TaxID=500713 RepID=UPI0031706F1C
MYSAKSRDPVGADTSPDYVSRCTSDHVAKPSAGASAIALGRAQSRGRSQSAPTLFYPGAADVWYDSNGSPAQSPFETAIPSPLTTSFPSTPKDVRPAAPDQFAYYLPYELQIEVMQALLDVCSDDWQREVRDGTWKGEKARERWSEGEARGRRELVRISRVSKRWRALALDGQLWPDGPSTRLIGSDALRSGALARLFDESGAFVKTLDLRGSGKTVTSKLLESIIHGAGCLHIEGKTRLATIDLTGCLSLSSRSISLLLSSSPSLQAITLFALPQIVDSHISTLARSCPQLASLNVSRCRNLAAPALLNLCQEHRRSDLRLQVVKAANLAQMTDAVAHALFTAHPELVVVDINFSPLLTDRVFERIFDLQDPPDYPGSEIPSQAPFFRTSDGPRRVLAHLQHLNLTGCSGLTSRALSYFHTPSRSSLVPQSLVPNLRTLELSRLPRSFDRSNHLSRFLESVRSTLIKLDLEDGVELDDPVLVALGPSPTLECLIINACSSFSDAAISDFVRQCTRLLVLEADGTDISDSTSKEFIRLVQARQLARTPDEAQIRKLSILDNRMTARRLVSRGEIDETWIRTRTGSRGWWTGQAVGFYHDQEDEDIPTTQDSVEEEENQSASRNKPTKRGLEECDPDRIVVRSFYSHLQVDVADLERERRRKQKQQVGQGQSGSQIASFSDVPGGFRIRSMSDSAMLVSSSNSRRLRNWRHGASTGCIVM